MKRVGMKRFMVDVFELRRNLVVQFLCMLGCMLGYFCWVGIAPFDVKAQQVDVQSDLTRDLAFDRGISAYNQGDYTSALEYFRTSSSPIAPLFVIKTHVADQRCAQAMPMLRAYQPPTRQLSESELRLLSHEKDVLRSLCQVQAREFPLATLTLVHMLREPLTAKLRTDIENRLKSLVPFLLDHEWDVLQSTDLSQDEYSRLQQYRQRTRSLPLGFTYRVGVYLPFSDPDESIQQIVRSMARGLTLAVEQANGSKPLLHLEFIDSQVVEPAQLASTLDSLRVDLVIGPLFTDEAQTSFSTLASRQIPALVPFSSALPLQEGGSPFFQWEPPLTVHASYMASYAFETLGLDTVSILSDRTSDGYIASQIFRNEFSSLGGVILDTYFEDFAANGFELDAFTERLDPQWWMDQSTAPDSLKEILGPYNMELPQAIYAPLDGTYESTLIPLLSNSLDALNANIPILGTPAWLAPANQSASTSKLTLIATRSSQSSPDSAQAVSLDSLYVQRYNEVASSPYWLDGYDLGAFLGQLVESEPHPSNFFELLRQQRFQGTTRRVHFEGTATNQSVEVVRRQGQN
ncbi:MAG: ABC transporter substrate-binding protein [Balneolaceae bacterium]|nr:ABC transporter substrate-binding protein [Balneolaceae bacterium]